MIGRHTSIISSAPNPRIHETMAPASVKLNASPARFCVLNQVMVVPVRLAVPRRKKAKIISFGIVYNSRPDSG